VCASDAAFCVDKPVNIRETLAFFSGQISEDPRPRVRASVPNVPFVDHIGQAAKNAKPRYTLQRLGLAAAGVAGLSPP
jgi:hypothetical protein